MSCQEDDIPARMLNIYIRTGSYGSINGTARLADPGYAEFVVNFDKVPCMYLHICVNTFTLHSLKSYDFDPQLPRP